MTRPGLSVWNQFRDMNCGHPRIDKAVLKPKFRNLGIVLVLVVVLVLGALAFCAGKDPHLSCNYFVPLARGFSRTRTTTSTRTTPQLRSVGLMVLRPEGADRTQPGVSTWFQPRELATRGDAPSQGRKI